MSLASFPLTTDGRQEATGDIVNLEGEVAATILGYLGLSATDLFECDGADFKGRVLLARALVPGEASAPGCGSGGLSHAPCWSGYTQVLLDCLEQVAEVAIVQGVNVAWG